MPVPSSYVSVVQSLYIAYFDRPADPSELSNFENALAAADAPTTIAGLQTAYSTNPAVAALVDSFGTSAASVARYGDVSTESSAQSFVNAIFENGFNHSESGAGLTFYVDEIIT